MSLFIDGQECSSEKKWFGKVETVTVTCVEGQRATRRGLELQQRQSVVDGIPQREGVYVDEEVIGDEREACEYLVRLRWVE